MLVDKIDFVEFDRQWRQLFEPNCPHELVVNDTPVPILDHAFAQVPVPQACRKQYGHVFSSWNKGEAGHFLSWAHQERVREMRVAFRPKPEPLPRDWEIVNPDMPCYRRVVSKNVSMWMVMDRPAKNQCELSFKFKGECLTYGIRDNLTLTQAAEACERMAKAALKRLVCEIAHEPFLED